MTKKKKSNAGRKSLSHDEKKQQIRISVKGKDIDRRGGIEACQKIAIDAIEKK